MQALSVICHLIEPKRPPASSLWAFSIPPSTCPPQPLSLASHAGSSSTTGRAAALRIRLLLAASATNAVARGMSAAMARLGTSCVLACWPVMPACVSLVCSRATPRRPHRSTTSGTRLRAARMQRPTCSLSVPHAIGPRLRKRRSSQDTPPPAKQASPPGRARPPVAHPAPEASRQGGGKSLGLTCTGPIS